MTDRQVLVSAAASAGVSAAKARRLVRRVQALVLEAVGNGRRVVIPGFGVFKPVVRAERKVRNPRTGREMVVPASRTVVFGAAADLRRRLNGTIADRREREVAEWESRKEREKYVPFDESLMPASKEEPDMAVEVPSSGPVSPPEAEGGGDEGREGRERTAEVRGPETELERRLRLAVWVGGAGLGVLLLLVVGLTVRTALFQRSVRTWMEAQGSETKMSLAEMERKVMERLAEMDLDVSQAKEALRKEMAALRSEQERRVEEALGRRIAREAARRSGGRRPLIKVVRYTVRKGDNLWKISAAESGNPYNWVGIYRTNGERIRHPDRIYPGQVILIPVVIAP